MRRYRRSKMRALRVDDNELVVEVLTDEENLMSCNSNAHHRGLLLTAL